ncbi:hypothetical protein M011DRAFT_447080 [Sporormia fimetaria CBS 119925]|uniref:FCP1 homology domain-containing protein n=1 Tax=Sporormia fimetaria CBS 119925 TaxID=1340428 RepID=A0A6A6V5B4_9PLEO|nr:hypothetical protein M011DRAFT_447080 [Sporormia fimetaria CBS 119925]
MNSLNILSYIGTTPPPSPPRSRAPSESNIQNAAIRPALSDADEDAVAKVDDGDEGAVSQTAAGADHVNEKTPLLDHPSDGRFEEARMSKAWLMPKRISDAIIRTMRWILAVIAAPATYFIACFYEEDGRFSLLNPVYKISRALRPGKRKSVMDPVLSEKEVRPARRPASSRTKRTLARTASVASSVAITSDSEESERPPTRDEENDFPSRHTRSKSNASTAEEIAPAKRSIRIKLHSDEALRQRKPRTRKQSSASNAAEVSPEAAAALKSPTGPSAVPSKQLTKFPRAPQPPRPLVPRRQPSYSTSATSAVGPHQKTLIIDLDETLIHSMAKGGRYTTGHMVEVKLQQPVGAGGQMIGPQVPILYYVHKRPHCDEFLKKVCKWYNLIIFTASVQEYADPVIDWLEVERKYFAGRYYRQHCTFRNGAYIKDLAQVEPDLSKVMIIDNSPMSYIFHEDNAIPIEGWISDPTDNDLLHLIPLLEGLQYVTDVRALLALRRGQPQSV